MRNDYFNIGTWIKEKMNYHKQSDYKSIKHKQINQMEIWICDFGYNIGQEKNKKRPVIILSNNRANRSGKVLVAPITDAANKINNSNLPIQNTWYLLYSETRILSKMFKPNRVIPKNATSYYWLDKDSIIQCEEMTSVSKARLLKSKIGDLEKDDWNKLIKKINNVFDI